MDQESIENRKKDKILQILNDICEENAWGDKPGRRVIIKFEFAGKLNIYPPEVTEKPKNYKPLL